MADILTRNQSAMISSAPETSFNTNYTLSSAFTGLASQSFNVDLPFIEKVYNDKLVFTGTEFADSFTNDWASNPQMTITDRLNTAQAALLVARCLSGTVTDSVVTAGQSYKHVIKMQTSTSDPQIKSSTIALKMGALELFLAGMVVNNFSVEFNQGQQSTYSANLVGSGRFSTPSSLTYSAPVAQNYLGTQAASTLTMNDGSSFDLAQRVQSCQFAIQNNVITGDRRLGDPLITSGDPLGGAYAGRLIRGDRSASLSMTVFASDSGTREWLDCINGTTITNVTYEAKGGIIGASSDRHSFKIIYPKAVISVLKPNDLNPQLGYQLTFMPLKASGEPGLVTVEIVNGTATLT